MALGFVSEFLGCGQRMCLRPIEFLQSRIDESEAKYDFGRAKVYERFFKILFGALVVAGMILLGLILNWLGFETSDE